MEESMVWRGCHREADIWHSSWKSTIYFPRNASKASGFTGDLPATDSQTQSRSAPAFVRMASWVGACLQLPIHRESIYNAPAQGKTTSFWIKRSTSPNGIWMGACSETYSKIGSSDIDQRWISKWNSIQTCRDMNQGHGQSHKFLVSRYRSPRPNRT